MEPQEAGGGGWEVNLGPIWLNGKVNILLHAPQAGSSCRYEAGGFPCHGRCGWVGGPRVRLDRSLGASAPSWQRQRRGRWPGESGMTRIVLPAHERGSARVLLRCRVQGTGYRVQGHPGGSSISASLFLDGWILNNRASCQGFHVSCQMLVPAPVGRLS